MPTVATRFRRSTRLLYSDGSRSAYRFLCDFYPLWVRTDLREPDPFSELHVVPTAWSGNQLPRGLRVIVGTSVYGTVSERVDGSLQPVAGATVSLDGGLQDPPAKTSATGFYMICSTVGGDQFRDIAAQSTGYIPITRRIFGGWDYEVNLELARR